MNASKYRTNTQTGNAARIALTVVCSTPE
jgi:hypothetical protein